MATDLSPLMEAFVQASAAGVGGMCSTGLLYPMDLIKNKLASGKSRESAMNVVKRVQREEGLPGFFKDVQYKMVQSYIAKSFFFYNYTALQGLIKASAGSVSTPMSLLAGYVAEMMHLPITLPMEQVTTTVMVGGKNSPGVVAETQRLYKENGLKGFYKSFPAYWVLCTMPAIQYAIFERVKAFWLRGSQKALGAAQAFFLGAFSRAVASTIVYPYVRAKIVVSLSKKKLAAQGEGAGAGAAGKPKSITEVISDIVKNEGFMSLYQGLPVQLARGVLSAAIMLMLKEKLSHIIRAFFLRRTAVSR